MVSFRPRLAEVNRRVPLISVLLFCVCCFSASASDTNALLTAWLNAQTNIHTWSADLIQTRRLKALVQPLTATGHVWFATPNRFRWELGHPPQTIAVKNADEMLVIYPSLKRVERYPLTGRQPAEWRDMLSLLEAGFPRDRADLDSHFKFLSQSVSHDVCEVVLAPNSASARRMMPQMKIAFDTNDFALRTTELEFADGSTMRNDFTNAELNVKIEDSLFTPKLDPDFKITEPFAQ